MEWYQTRLELGYFHSSAGHSLGQVLGGHGHQVQGPMETSERVWSAPPSLLEEDGTETSRCAQGSVFSSPNLFPLTNAV